MLKLYVRCWSAMLLDLCPKGLWRAMLDPFGGSNARIEATFWGRWGRSLAILGPVEVPGSYSSASCGKVGSQVGLCYVMLKLYVRFCSAMFLVLLSPQQDQDFKWVSASDVASIWGPNYGYLVAMLAPLAPSWDQLRPSRGSWWCYVCSVGGCNTGVAKNHRQKLAPPKQNLLKNANPHGREAKRIPPSRAIWVRCFCENCQLERSSATSTPCAASGVGRFSIFHGSVLNTCEWG